LCDTCFMGNLIGYARVSTHEQNVDLQIDALKAAGCSKIFTDHGVSGTKASRPELDNMMKYSLNEGDTLVVWKLDRIARNTKHFLTLVDDLQANGVEFRSLSDGIATGGAVNRAFLTVLSAFSELEHSTMLERTHNGLAAARARGRVGGRKPSLTAGQAEQCKALYDAKTTVTSIAKTMGVSRQTVYRYLEGQRESVDA
jgi:DNA invertase Pin-like site-specific DNA recombinase